MQRDGTETSRFPFFDAASFYQNNLNPLLNNTEEAD